MVYPFCLLCPCLMQRMKDGIQFRNLPTDDIIGVGSFGHFKQELKLFFLRAIDFGMLTFQLKKAVVSIAWNPHDDDDDVISKQVSELSIHSSITDTVSRQYLCLATPCLSHQI